MRTIIAPLLPEVQAELDALDPKRAGIARRYLRRLALEPMLGAPVERGPLVEYQARRVRFDVNDNPDNLFGNRPAPRRRGDQDLSDGPKWRIVYWVQEAPRAGIRLVVILAIGVGHADPGHLTAYERAAARAGALERRTP